MCNADLQESHRHLVKAFGPEVFDADSPLTASWSRAADPTARAGGDLILDPHNRRLKLYGPTAAEACDPGLSGWVDCLRTFPHLFSKLIVYARPGGFETWVTAGYLHEGIIAGFFADGQEAHMWAVFGDETRSDAPRDARHDEIVRIAAAKPVVTPEPAPEFSCRRAGTDLAQPIVDLMTDTFPDYPTPISADLIGRQIANGTNIFRYIENADGDVVASASAEIDHVRQCAEMTDCATRPDQRGAGHMGLLLHRLARDLREDFGITDLYTLARADEVGMNCVFGKLDYAYTGRLINNCRMPNGWESMNIWCLSTAGDPGGDETRV